MKPLKKYRMTWILFSVLLVIAAGIITFINQPKFGKIPSGERLGRVKTSPNYRDGKFQNLSPTIQITSEKSKIGSIIDFLFRDANGLRPEGGVPSVKTDLKQFKDDEEVLVWLGHSSLFIQTGGKRILVDPVFIVASPVSFVNKPFKGTDSYKPEDMPDIDYLIITHDHWDHLDYHTVMRLKERTKHIICSLGVGEHFEYWGFGKERVTELDWNEKASLGNEFTIHCLPARHFSGRGLSANKTLWASYLLQSPSRNIYISGDTGYDSHFSTIGKQFEKIDLAILENGQYNEEWKYIHLMPEYLSQAAKELHAKRVLSVHNSKYALSKHAWKEPLNNMVQTAAKDSLNLMTPMIGEPVYLNDSTRAFRAWWENIN